MKEDDGGDGAESVADREYEMSNHIRLQPHPCIVTLFQVLCFPDNGFYMIVMELCPNGDLMRQMKISREEALVAERAYEPVSTVPGWAGQIFLALEHIHVRVKAIMRDLKPENVVIGETGLAKLTDFGLGLIEIVGKSIGNEVKMELPHSDIVVQACRKLFRLFVTNPILNKMCVAYCSDPRLLFIPYQFPMCLFVISARHDQQITAHRERYSTWAQLM